LANILRKMANKNSQNLHIFSCNICDYNTCKSSDYAKHLLTTKHKRLTMANENLSKSPEVALDSNIFMCVCNKKYNHMSSLCKHRKKCSKNNTSKTDLDTSNTGLDEEADKIEEADLEPSSKDIIKMMKMQMIENQEIRSLIIELLKKETINTINNNINNNNNISNNNCNNQSFNLNFFLNEQCKDAMNIDEFVDSIKMNLSDLENFAHLGYADGVSNIFAKGIKELGVHLRPIHCSDTKRETLYIKNNDEWIKETDDKPLITKAIKKVAFKNIKQINEWVKENPACKDPRTKKYDQYNKIVMNAMSGVTEEEQKNNIEKIVKNVTKSVAIEKYAIQ
jgi:hypothetical protein